MRAAKETLPIELVLRFVRDQVAANRARAPSLSEGALTFAVRREATGLTDHFTLFIRPDDVTLEAGAAPLDQPGPIAALYGTERALSQLTRGEAAEGIGVEGDEALIAAVALCFGGTIDPLRVRSKR
ncbi:MAG: hypothetical protein IT384_11255 [Deltaproteobacteria bacterium]|nr:hypothetical protein [Deltaproteobacteria bacterium]